MLLQHFHTITVFLIIVMALIGAGSIFRQVESISKSLIERLWWQSILGSAVLGTLLFLVGYFIWSAYWIIPFILVLVLQGAKTLYSDRDELKSAFVQWIRLPGSWIVILTMSLFFLTGLVAPYGAISHDGISYHLLPPAKWPEIGQVVSLPEHSHTAFPFLIEMLFGVTVILGSISASGLIGILFFAQLMGCVWYLSKDLDADRRTRSMIVGISATMPVLISTTDDYFVDMPFAIFALAMLRLIARFPATRYMLMAGILAGAAGATKYTGLFVMFSGGLLIIYLNRHNLKSLFISGLYFSFIAILVAAPWYLRNYIDYGNPIIPPPPFLYQTLPALGWPDFIAEAFHKRIQIEVGAGFGKSFLDFILLPFNFTFYADQFRGGHGTYFAFFFAPFALWKLRKKRIGLIYLSWALIITTIWFLTQQNARFIIHVVALFMAFCSLSYQDIMGHRFLVVKGMGLIFILVTIGIGIYGFGMFRHERLSAVFTKDQAKEVAINNTPFYSAIEFVNSNQEVNKVLLLSKWVPGLFIEKPYVKTAGHYGNRPFPDINSPQEALLQLDRWDCSHVIDTKNDYWVIDPADQKFQLVFESEDAKVYKINP